MSRWVRGCLIVTLMMVLVLFTACSGNEADEPASKVDMEGDLTPLDERAEVVIAEDGSASGAGFYIAEKLGYFDAYNIDVSFTTFTNSDDMLPALASGEIDIAGGISSASFFNSIAQGINVKMIGDKGHNLSGNSYFSFVIGKDKQDEIKDYADLKGKKVAVSTENGVDDYIYQKMLDSAGLSRKDVEFVLMPDFGNMLSAIANGSIDAALQIEPSITQGVSDGMHVRLGDATDFAPDAQIAMVLASPDFVSERKEVAVRFMAAYIQALRDYNDAFVKKTGDLDKIIDIMTEYTPLDDKKLWEDVSVTGLDPNGQMQVENIEDQYKFYKDRGAIKGDVNMEDAIDMSIVEEALKHIGKYEE